MKKYEVKILSYIANFRKVIFICPLCRENNSLVLDDEQQREKKFRCDGCRQSYLAGVSSLEPILSSMGKDV
jgi:transposase-like protein